MLVLPANPLGSGAAGGFASLTAMGLDFGIVSPFGDGLTTPCKTDTGELLEEALGIALATKGDADCSITSGTAHGTSFRTARGIALSTELKTASGTAVGHSTGRGLRSRIGSGIGAISGSETGTVIITGCSTVFGSLVERFGVMFGTASGTGLRANLWATFGGMFGTVVKSGLGVGFRTAMDILAVVDERFEINSKIDATCGGLPCFCTWLDVTLSCLAPSGRRSFDAKVKNPTDGSLSIGRPATTVEVLTERIGSPRNNCSCKRAGLTNDSC